MRGILLRVVIAATLLMPVSAIVNASQASAHPGRTAGDGCHYCRTNCASWGETAGTRHCHGGGDGGGGGDSSSGGAPPPPPPPPPPRPRDTTPPERPVVGAASVQGAQVSLPVTAEAGARLAVTSGTSVLHRARATGSRQTLSFTAPDGRHRLEVIATDGAGNDSEAAAVTVTVDGTPPEAAAVIVVPAKPSSPRTTLRISGEPAGAYRLTVTRPDDPSAPVAHESGRLLGDGEASESLLLPNGAYVATVTVTDPAGNESPERRETFDVAIAPPDKPTVAVASKRGANPLVLLVEGAPFGRATVRLRGEGAGVPKQVVELDASGSGEAEFDVEDGMYAAVAELEDFQSQPAPAPARLRDIPVKQTPPKLAVTLQQQELANGRLGYVISAEPGTRLTVRVDGGDPLTVEANGDDVTDALRVEPGARTLSVLAVDEFGNETLQELLAQVADPVGLGDALLVLLVLGVPGYVLFRKRPAILGRLRGLRPSPQPAVAAEEPEGYDPGA